MNTAKAFVILIWISLLLFMANDAYKKLMNTEMTPLPNPKTMKELLDVHS